MRLVQRDKREIWYALYQGVTDVLDADGNLTGEQEVRYAAPVKTRMNVSGGRGQAAIEEFGIDNPFKVTAVTDDLTTPFNTDTVFWFGHSPTEGPYNFRCTDISRTVNQVVLALAEVTVSEDPVISG